MRWLNSFRTPFAVGNTADRDRVGKPNRPTHRWKDATRGKRYTND